MSFHRRAVWPGRVALSVLLSFTTLACKKPQVQQEMPPLQVSVVHPIEREVTEYAYYTGTTRGRNQTEVSARVPGYLQKIHYQPDRYVQAGELLFTIDQTDYKIAVDRAAADLAVKKAETVRAQADFDRVQSLVAKNAASEQELINRRADLDKAIGNEQASAAALDQARRDLELTEIKAPFSGRVSRNFVDIGTNIKNDQTVLATIVDDEVILVSFDVSERDFLDYLRANPEARRVSNDKEYQRTYIDVATQNDVGFPHRGVITSVNPIVDVSTATLKIWAELPNHKKLLAPGLTVHVRAAKNTAKSLLVPDIAVQADARGQFVYVVNEQDIVERRAVQSGQQVGPYRQILDGLTLTDRVITTGLMMARPEAKVVPTLIEPPELPSTQPATQPTTQQ